MLGKLLRASHFSVLVSWMERDLPDPSVHCSAVLCSAVQCSAGEDTRSIRILSDIQDNFLKIGVNKILEFRLMYSKSILSVCFFII